MSSSACCLEGNDRGGAEWLLPIPQGSAAPFWPLAVRRGREHRTWPSCSLVSPVLPMSSLIVPDQIYFPVCHHLPLGWMLFWLDQASSGNVKLIVSSVAPAGLLWVFSAGSPSALFPLLAGGGRSQRVKAPFVRWGWALSLPPEKPVLGARGHRQCSTWDVVPHQRGTRHTGVWGPGNWKQGENSSWSENCKNY